MTTTAELHALSTYAAQLDTIPESRTQSTHARARMTSSPALTVGAYAPPPRAHECRSDSIGG